MKPTPGDERPPAPWGSFPLAELVILAGIVMLVVGLFGGGPTAIGIGVGLAGLGGMEVAIREHLAGFRSHTTLLAGAVFVLVVALLFYVAGQVLAVASPSARSPSGSPFSLLRRAFRRASGGLAFKVGRRGSRLDRARSEGRPRPSPPARAASSARWRGVRVPSRLFSLRATPSRNLRARVRPQRRWLVSSSARVMLSVSQGQSRTTVDASMSPRPIDRFSSARASRTRLARARACMCCGAWILEASSLQGRSKLRPLGLLPKGS